MQVLEDIDFAAYTRSAGVSSAYRWFAPEVSKAGTMTPSSDVFSFAMTMLEVIAT